MENAKKNKILYFCRVKAIFHKTVAVSMSMFLLLSTVTWTVDMHLCMGRTMDVAFFSKAESCGMDMAMELLGDDTLENHCCDDRTVFVKGQKELKLQLDFVDLEPVVATLLPTPRFEHYVTYKQRQSLWKMYHPPPRDYGDLHVLLETFLI